MSFVAGLVISPKASFDIEKTILSFKNSFENLYTGYSISIYKKNNFVLMSAFKKEDYKAKYQIIKDDAFAVVTDEPYLSIHEDVLKIPDALPYLVNDSSSLKRCRGTFSFCYYSDKEKNLLLATDKIGVWPMYFYRDESLMIFSTQLKFIKKQPYTCMELDTTGLMEEVLIGYPLNERTRYKNIMRLEQSGFININIENFSFKIEKYWRWEDNKLVYASEKDALADCKKRFYDAIKIRLEENKNQLCFLSGGMDSRFITSALKELGASITGVNFSNSNSQDAEFAKEYARSIHCTYYNIERQPGEFVNFTNLICLARDNFISKTNNLSEYVWSGDGGSVSLGYVYLTEKIETAKNNPEALEQALFEKICQKFPKYTFSPELKKEMDKIKLDIANSMQELYKRNDILRSAHFFLMFNDQSRHLSQSYFEKKDIDYIDFKLPFYDTEFLLSCFALPVESYLYHRFYNKLYDIMPAFIRSTPWQTYPGHIPCPVPYSKSNLTYQWKEEASYSYHDLLKNRLFILKEIFKRCTNKSFKDYLNNSFFGIVMLLYILGFKNTFYRINFIIKLLEIEPVYPPIVIKKKSQE